jgi:hypothetical protein
MSAVNPVTRVGMAEPMGMTIRNFTRRGEALDEALDKLLAFVCEELGVTMAQLRSGNRKREIVTARRIYYALTEEVLWNHFTPTITLQLVSGKIGQQHASMLSALKVHSNEMDTDKRYAKDYKSMRVRFTVTLSPTTIEGLLSARRILKEKMDTLSHRMAEVDADLCRMGYTVNENGDVVKAQKEDANG